MGFTIGPTNTDDMIIRGAYGSFEQNAFTNPLFVNTVALSGGVRLSNPGQGVTAATSGVRATQATSTDFENARTTWGAEPQFTWYQVPMLGGFARLAKPFITGGMRKDTDPRYRPNAIIVFGGTGPWKSRLGVGDDRLAYLVLIDRQGVVRWRYGGLFNQAMAAELDAQVRALLGPSPATGELP